MYFLVGLVEDEWALAHNLHTSHYFLLDSVILSSYHHNMIIYYIHSGDSLPEK